MHIFAAIEIPPQPGGFYDFAAHLERFLGVSLTETDRFNELPGFVGSRGSIKYTLIGPEPGTDTDSYRLDVNCVFMAGDSIENLVSQANEFERSFLTKKDLDESGGANLSGELASAMGRVGFQECRPI